MEPLQFLKRLAVLLPAPYQNLVRYHGVFANRSRYRTLLPRPPEANHGEHRDDDNDVRTHRCIVDPPLESWSGQQTTLSLQDHDDLAETGDNPVWADPSDQDQPAVRPRRLPWASCLGSARQAFTQAAAKSTPSFDPAYLLQQRGMRFAEPG